jgi:2-amino-4-hydroxy-6-hydroxymethyldihydropteridine diphosphokinase
VAVAYLSLGSNQGDSTAILVSAVADLDSLPGTRVDATSHLYRTAAQGMVDQPDYLNLIVRLETRLGPWELLDEIHRLETKAGRVRVQRWGPRTLDIDIVWYDGLAFKDERLEVPHPRMLERRFVLEPLSELAPDLIVGGGRSAKEALTAVEDQRVERIGTQYDAT